MPLLAINISDKLFLEIKTLVENGSYQSFESFLEIAAFNQLALERGASPAEIIEKGHRKIRQEGADITNGTAVRTSKPASKEMKQKQAPAPKKPVARTDPPEVVTISDEEADLAFKRLIKVAFKEESPRPCKAVAGHDPEDRVFGQVNRLFPMKLACRWLATAAITEKKWPRFDVISDRLADDAATIGSILEQWDAESGHKRDELLATGLPRRANPSSRDRFLSQFVARVTRAGEIYPGAVCQYELAKFEDSALVLTEEGLAFANLDNHILDTRTRQATASLSETETDFLVRQVLAWVPSERNDMNIILAAIREGKTTPPDLAVAVQGKFPREWTQSMTLTHVSGLVARLAELRLLRRQWQGRNVNYELAQQGQIKNFFERTDIESGVKE